MHLMFLWHTINHGLTSANADRTGLYYRSYWSGEVLRSTHAQPRTVTLVLG